MQPMPDIAVLMKIAQSPAGKKLLSILQNSPSVDLNSMSAAAASGNLEEAKQLLNSVLSGKEAQDLLKELEKQL